MLIVLFRSLGVQNSNPYSRRCRAVVITRPPEIVVCLRIPIRLSSVYAVFDSHPRPKHPNGAAFTFFPTASRAAAYLASLLHVDARLLDEGAGLQWQAQLLGNVVGHFFAHSGANIHMSDRVMTAFIESNLSLLRTKAEAMEIKARCNELKRENEMLMKEMRGAEAKKRATVENTRKVQLEEERKRERERNATKGSHSQIRYSIGHPFMWGNSAQTPGSLSKTRRLTTSPHEEVPVTPSSQPAVQRHAESRTPLPSTSIKATPVEKPRYSDEGTSYLIRYIPH